MGFKQWIGSVKEVDEAAGQVAEQLKLTLDRSDAIDLMKEIEVDMKGIDLYRKMIKEKQDSIRTKLKKIRKIL